MAELPVPNSRLLHGQLNSMLKVNSFMRKLLCFGGSVGKAAPLLCESWANESAFDCYVYDANDDVNPPWDYFNKVEGYFWAGKDSGNVRFGAGLRFGGISIPQGATIVKAYLYLTANNVAGSVDLTGTVVRTNIFGEASDDAALFLNLADYNGRVRTSASVAWDNIPAWVNNVVYESPDFAAIIQEIINRAGWVVNNRLVLFWENDFSDTGAYRVAWSYDGGGISKCAVLRIYYYP